MPTRLAGRRQELCLERAPNPPAAVFWSVSVYDVKMRTLIKTDLKKPTVGSIQGFDENSDGSISIYIGPDAPEGKERNWIKTIPEQGWFPYFRFYSPTEPFFDGTLGVAGHREGVR
ncbi:MAG: DUF1214 domain-containing protein [Rhodobacteraceae bacterium]|nr:DUF1214 domain-containing protein [Paracoccaceae bacterium]